MLKTYFGNDVKSIQIMKGCEWKLYKEAHALEMEAFWNSSGLVKTRPMNRLVPRLTVRGGLIETFRLKFDLKENPDYDIYFLDVNSLYSKICLNNEFGVGPYKVIIDPKDLSNIAFVNGEFLYKGESMKADACHVRILPPENLKKPFLPYRFNNEFNFLSLCRTCVLKKNASTCKHSDIGRALTSCYMVSEINYCVKNLNYTVLNWFEVHHYSKTSPYLKDYVKVLGAEKLKNSNILENVPCNEEQSFCDNLNESMEFDPLYHLTPENAKDNFFQKQFYKDLVNSFFGRFAIKGNYNKHIFCKTLREIENLANKDNNNLVDLIPINDNICEIELSFPQKCKPNLNGNLYVTSLINCLSREYIYDKIIKVENEGGIVLSCDVDSLTFALKKGTQNPLEVNPKIGAFKHVLPNCKIISYLSMSPRNYLILYLDDKDEIKQLLKVKGLCLTSNNCDKIITPELYDQFVKLNFENDIKNVYVPQMRKLFNKPSKTYTEILSGFNFTSESHVKRFILKNSKTYETLPYGYKFNHKTLNRKKEN